jgi:hypothetical protein
VTSRRAFLLLSITLLAHARAAGQSRLAELGQALGELQSAAESLPPDRRPEPLVQSITWLIGRVTATDARQVSGEYIDSLRRAAALLRQKPSQDVIDDVTSELQTKVEHCRTLGIGMGGSVLLRINTRRGAQPASDQQVFYLLKIYERLSSVSPNTFPKLSSPTESRVEPGRYWVWARDPSTGRTSERVLVRVAGQTEFTADIPVP